MSNETLRQAFLVALFVVCGVGFAYQPSTEGLFAPSSFPSVEAPPSTTSTTSTTVQETTTTEPPTTTITQEPTTTTTTSPPEPPTTPSTAPPTTVATTTPQTVPTTVQSNTAGVWDKLAECETGGNWSHPPVGSGFSGGIMFHIDTWVAMGGTKYASQPYLATKAQQIAVAEDLLAEVGSFQPWPGCRKKLGLY